jgi:hypothetical protein
VCTTGNPNGTQSYSSTYFHSAAEAKTIQDLHDKATAGGAKCNALSSQAMYATMAELAFAGSRHSKADLADIQKIHDIAAKQGADCAAAMGGLLDPARRASSRAHGNLAAMSSGKTGGKTRMSFTDTITDQFNQLYKLGRAGRDLLRRHGGELPDENVFEVVDDGVKFAVEQARTEENARLEAERTKALADVEALKKEGLRLQIQNMTIDAASFADKLIVENRILPAQKDALVRSLVLDAQSDAALGPVTFAEGVVGTRVEATKALWSQMPVLNLTGERLRTAVSEGATFSIVPADGSTAAGVDDKEKAARKAKILAQTPQGRAFLAQQNKTRGA